MPLVFEQEGFEVWVYIYDENKHAYVSYKGGETIVDLEAPELFASDYPAYQQAYAERAQEIVVENLERILEAWEECNRPLEE